MKNLIGSKKWGLAALRTWGPAAVGAGIACALCAANPASAKSELNRASTITCSSDNGQRQYCEADTRRGVRLIRQVRGSGCQPATWGYDVRGVWVDRGCQAVFDLSGGTTVTKSDPTKMIAAGTAISVRTSELIDVLKSDGHVFSGAVDQNVLDETGDIAIPKGSYAKFIVKTISDRYLALDLELVEVDGLRYVVTTNGDRAESARRAGIGPSPRSGDFVDGRALIGSITQLFTGGRAVKIPAESFLTFRLAQPLAIGGQ
jgi:DUF3011 family protein